MGKVETREREKGEEEARKGEEAGKSEPKARVSASWRAGRRRGSQ